jgi:hypothetical protein
MLSVSKSEIPYSAISSWSLEIVDFDLAGLHSSKGSGSALSTDLLEVNVAGAGVLLIGLETCTLDTIGGREGAVMREEAEDEVTLGVAALVVLTVERLTGADGLTVGSSSTGFVIGLLTGAPRRDAPVGLLRAGVGRLVVGTLFFFESAGKKGGDGHSPLNQASAFSCSF